MRRLRSITFAHAGETMSRPCLPGDSRASLSPSSPPLNQEGGLVGPQLRASNEHLGCHAPSKLARLAYPRGGW